MVNNYENLTKEEVDQRIRELKIMKLQKMSNIHAYYVPTGKGQDFINATFGGVNFITLYAAANACGKTYLAINALANLFWPTDNIFFKDQPLIKKWPYPKKGRIVSEPNTIVETIIPGLKKIFPKGRYTAEKNGKHFESKWTTDTGWEFTIMTYDQDPKEFESATVGFVWHDEPGTQSIYKANISRLRQGGVLFMTATPLDGSGWIYDEIVTNESHEGGNRAYITADVESACEEHGVRGFLKHKDIENMIAQYSEEEKHARIHGKFQHLTGLVYKQFARDVHVIKPFLITPQDYVVIEMLDPHPRNPDAVCWIAIDKYGQKFYIDELYEPVNSTEELAQRIKMKAANYRVEQRYIDPSAFIVDQHKDNGKCLADRLSDYGLNYSPATKDREGANRRLGDALNYQRVGNDFILTPEFYIFENCNRIIFEIEHWRWDEWTGKSRDNKDRKGKPIDKDDHEIENVGRCLLLETTFFPYRENKEYWGNENIPVIGSGSSDDPY